MRLPGVCSPLSDKLVLLTLSLGSVFGFVALNSHLSKVGTIICGSHGNLAETKPHEAGKPGASSRWVTGTRPEMLEVDFFQCWDLNLRPPAW